MSAVSLLSAAILGAIQGVTEFLPVSSSAHLIFARELLGWDLPPGLALPFFVACHVGTLVAVLACFRTDLVAMLRALPTALSAEPSPDGQRIRLIVVGTLPIVVVGLLWADAIQASVQTPTIAAVALVVGASLLFLVERMGAPRGDERSISARDALLIGFAQALALVPGVSRSGATIAAGMALGLPRAAAARFTFLMSVPAVLAAAAKEALEVRHIGLGQNEIAFFLVGIVSSAVVGYLTITFFLKFLVTHRLDVFAWYRIGLGGAMLLWLAAR